MKSKDHSLITLSISLTFIIILSALAINGSIPMKSSQVVFAQVSTNSTTSLDNSSYKFERGYPVGETANLAYDNADLSRATEAYKFFFPTMVTEAQMQVISPSDKPNEVGVKFAAGPAHQVFTANSDTPYAFAMLDLKTAGPIVIDVPQGNFLGGASDHNMRWILDIGLPGPDKGQGGKHLILPPGYKGKVPEGYYVGKSDTWKVFFGLRSLSKLGNTTKALQDFDNVKVYPLDKAPDPVTFKFIDVTNSTLPNRLLNWENNLTYWQQLKSVIDDETTPVDFRPIYGMLQSLGIEKGKPFNPDSRMTKILEEATNNAQAELRVSAYANREPQRIVWRDRNWEWLPLRQLNATTKDMGTASFLDLQAMDNAYFQAIGASPVMGKREVGAGSIYFAAFRDNAGSYLDGSNNYKLSFPGPVPGNLFWSATVYDVDTRSEIATDQNKAAVRSLFEKPEPNPDGSYDIYFGPTVPVGKENQWVKTIPDKGFFVYFRIYGPEAPAFNGAWKLKNIVETMISYNPL